MNTTIITFFILLFFLFKCLSNQVLHMDRNDYYGGESTSLNLIQVSAFWNLVNIFLMYAQLTIMLQTISVNFVH